VSTPPGGSRALEDDLERLGFELVKNPRKALGSFQIRGIYERTIPGAVVRHIAGVARPLLQLTAGPYLVSLDGRPFDEVVATVGRFAK
jgi:hypothetical protein